METNWPTVKLEEVLSLSRESVEIDPLRTYKQITVRLHHKGVVLREEKIGQRIKSKQYLAKEGQFIISRIDARNGAMGLVPQELDGAIVTNDFLLYEINEKNLFPKYFDFLTSTKSFVWECIKASKGTTNRVRLKPEKFLEIEISLPLLEEQKHIVARIESLLAKIEEARKLRGEAVKEAESLVVFARHNLIYLKKPNKLKDLVFDKAIEKMRGPKPGLPQKEYKYSGKFPVVDQGKDYIGGYTDDESRVFKVTEPVIVWGDHTTNSKLIDFDFVPGADGTKIFSPKEGLIAGYVNHFLKTVNYPELGYSRHYRYLKNLQIPLCSLPEQRRIVAYLDSFQAKVGVLKRLQAETEKELEELVPSILDKAFKGEL